MDTLPEHTSFTENEVLTSKFISAIKTINNYDAKQSHNHIDQDKQPLLDPTERNRAIDYIQSHPGVFISLVQDRRSPEAVAAILDTRSESMQEIKKMLITTNISEIIGIAGLVDDNAIAFRQVMNMLMYAESEPELQSHKDKVLDLLVQNLPGAIEIEPGIAASILNRLDKSGLDSQKKAAESVLESALADPGKKAMAIDSISYAIPKFVYEKEGLEWQYTEIRNYLEMIADSYGLNGEEVIRDWEIGVPYEREENESTSNFRSRVSEVLRRNIKIMVDLEHERPGILKVLKNQFDISNFGRYPLELLLQQYDLRNKRIGDIDNGKVVVGVFNKDDWNGSFYEPQNMLGQFSNRLQKYGHRLVIYEGGGSPAKLLLRAAKRYGKIPASVWSAHGSVDSMVFAKGYSWRHGKHSLITSEDVRESQAQEIARKVFTKDFKIILDACSTGLDLVQAISELGGNVVGPDNETALEDINVRVDSKERLILVPKYQGGPVSRFVGGKRRQ